ncbi:DUF930 domain-containing protein [Devosia sp.]|uniref:DUF930 domain-containing protein n=1 Tax=Devosia sp. TaxID=1871048 RepID=UPI003262D389
MPVLDAITRVVQQALGLRPALLPTGMSWVAFRPEARDARWPLPVSVGLHLLLGGLWLLVGSVHPLVVPRPHAIAVQLVSERQYRTATQPAPIAPAAPLVPVRTAPTRTAAAAAVVPAAKAGGMVQSSQYYASSILSEPANKEIRDTLPLLASDERIVQLCNIEALEQVHAWKPSLNPDTLVPYAFAETTVAGQTLTAEGGAIRDARQWYRFRFSCTASPDYQGVADFKFEVGELIPPEQWEAHSLSAEDDPAD